MGMILNFHKNYTARAMGGKDVVQIPSYLHIVISSDDQSIALENATKLDTFILQETLLEEMKKGLNKMYEFKGQFGKSRPIIDDLSEKEIMQSISHSTIFTPYFTESNSDIQK